MLAQPQEECVSDVTVRRRSEQGAEPLQRRHTVLQQRCEAARRRGVLHSAGPRGARPRGSQSSTSRDTFSLRSPAVRGRRTVWKLVTVQRRRVQRLMRISDEVD